NAAVRGDFPARLPENLARVTSVDDVHRTMTLFRALVGAGLTTEASTFWQQNLHEVLLRRLGAYPTVAELLAPLATAGSPPVRTALALAQLTLGRYDDAIAQQTGILADALRQEDAVATRLSLGGLALILRESGADAASSRCLDLLAGLIALDGEWDAD